MIYRLAAAVMGALVVAGCTRSITADQGLDAGARLLRQAQVASTQTDFQGLMATRLMTHGQWRVTEVRCYFAKPGLSRMEYITPPMTGVIEVQGQTGAWRYDPHSRKVVVIHGPQHPGQLAQDWRLIQNNYHLVVGPHRKIAGRDAIELDVVPRHSGNPWERFLIDSENKVILAQERYAPAGMPEVQSAFLSVEFKPVRPSLFLPPQAPALARAPMTLTHRMTFDQLQKAVGVPVVVPKWLPQGYRVQANYLTRCEDGCGSPVALILFSNGLNTFSLFQSKHIMDPPGACSTIMHPGVQDVRLVRNDSDYVLVGDLDPTALRRVALSIPDLAQKTASRG